MVGAGFYPAQAGQSPAPTSDRVGAALAGADADRLVDRADEDLAVADAPGMGGVLDRLDRALDQRVLHDDLDLHLGQEIDDVFGAAIELGVALLTPEPLRLGHRDSLDADLVQGFLHLVELERFDDRFDFLHCCLHHWPISVARRQTRLADWLSMVHASRQIAGFVRRPAGAPHKMGTIAQVISTFCLHYRRRSLGGALPRKCRMRSTASRS